jgi:hypothetical protein
VTGCPFVLVLIVVLELEANGLHSVITLRIRLEPIFDHEKLGRFWPDDVPCVSFLGFQ